MGVVGAILTMEVWIGVAPAAWAGGSRGPSFGLTLFTGAQASISVPSTEKGSLDRSYLGCASTAASNLPAMSPYSNRSRFSEN